MKTPEHTRLVKQLLASGLSREDIASKTKISYESICRYERGGHAMPHLIYIEQLRRLHAEVIPSEQHEQPVE